MPWAAMLAAWWDSTRGSITQTYATGDVKANIFNIGGLVGGNEGTITQSYATGGG